MIGGEGDLGRSHQKELVSRNLVDLLPGLGEEPGADQRLLTHQDRWDHRGETLGNEVVHCPAHQRELQQRPLALEIAEPASRHLGGADGVDDPERLAESCVIGSLGERLTNPLDLQAVLFTESLGSIGRHQIGHLEDGRVELRLQTVDFRRRLLDLTGEISHRRDGSSPWPVRRDPLSPAPIPSAWPGAPRPSDGLAGGSTRVR